MGEYPLYPELSEEGQKEAVALIEDFKAKLKKAADETIGELYCNVMPYIETDSWTNFRNELMAGFRDYGNRKIQGEYDFKQIRAAIFNDFREEIMAEMPEELREENARLRDQLKHLSEHRY